jgi:hypothetical protein
MSPATRISRYSAATIRTATATATAYDDVGQVL